MPRWAHLLVILTAFAVACSSHHHTVMVRWVPEAIPQEPIRVAVLPFESASDDASAVTMLSSLRAAFETELINLPNYRLVERAQLVSLLSDEVKFDKEFAARLEEKQVDAYIVGEVREVVDHPGHAELHAGVKLIDRRTGDVLWSANADVARLGTPEMIAHEFAATVVERLRSGKQEEE